MLPVILLLATAASCYSATKLRCQQHIFEELVARTSCGDNKSISKCLLSDVNLTRLDEIEQCYNAGGCSKADATVGAVWFAHKYRAEVRKEEERVELRRRADASDSKTDSATETTTDKKASDKTKSAQSTEKTESSAAASSAAASSTAAPSSAAASTTTESTTSDSKTSKKSASTASSTGSTTSTASTTSSTTTSSSSSSSTTSTSSITTGTLLCSTTKTVQTSMCSVSAGKTLSCVATETAISSCAPGNLCQTNASGEDTCMKIDNSVGAGGIAIAIVFVSAILAVAVGIMVMNYKANSVAKRREAEHQTLLGGYSNKGKGRAGDVEAYAPQTSEANLPLISEPGSQNYGQELVGHGRRAPQLHKGLGILA